MSSSGDHLTDDWDDSSVRRTVLICLFILVVCGGLLAFIFYTQPTARRAAGTRSTAMLVDVAAVDTGTYRPQIEAMGTVQPVRDIVLRSRVSGRVIDRSSEFTPGGFVEDGQLLLRLDPSDYRNTVRQRRSEVRQARSDLQLEMGQQDVAEQEYELLGDTLTPENRSLVLREPQLEAARSKLESARAALDQARLELRRTRIRAPFPAQILQRNVNIGSQVASGDNLARLVGIDTYWVETTVELSKLRWLDFPTNSQAAGSPVRIRDRSAWPGGVYRTGRVDRHVGELDDQARMARVLISVDDPLGRQADAADSPSLVVGSFVEVQIQGREIQNVVRLNRDYLREDGTVWVMQDGQLDIRDVQVVFQDEHHAYIRQGLDADDRVVTTNLSTVVDGAPLRLNGAESEVEGAPDADTSPKSSEGSA